MTMIHWSLSKIFKLFDYLSSFEESEHSKDKDALNVNNNLRLWRQSHVFQYVTTLSEKNEDDESSKDSNDV